MDVLGLAAQEKGEGKEQRFVVSTVQWTASTIRRKGRRRWKIEALFKVLKSRFGLRRFGQHSKVGVLRYFCLCLPSFLLCHLEDLASLERRGSAWPDWGELAARVRQKFCVVVRLAELEAEVVRLKAGLDSVLQL